MRFGMGKCSTIEGVIRQNTENPVKAYELTTLHGKVFIGYGVEERSGLHYVKSCIGDIPIYSVRMTSGLLRLLKASKLI